MIGKTNIEGKIPVWEEYCTVRAKDGLDETACDTIVFMMRKMVDENKIFVHQNITGQVADITKVLELADLKAVFQTELVVYTHNADLQQEVDEAAEIIMRESFDGPLT